MAVIEYDEYKQKLLALEPTLGELEKALGIPKAREELAELQKETEQEGFWNDLERSQQVSRQVKRLENKIKKHDKLVSEWEDTLTLCEMAQEEDDPSQLDDVVEGYNTLEKEISERRLAALLSGEYDGNNAILTFHAGAGGTEAQDWTEMLYRMYTRWAERHGFTYKIMDYQEGDEAGLKSATIMIEGENAYGYLGIVGVLGFLALLVLLLRNWDWRAGKTGTPRLGDRLWLLSRLNVMALLLATIAGFGGIIGILVRFIRGYNRISPYIAFFALLAVGLTAEKLLTQFTGRRRGALLAAAVLLLGYGYWEQQGLFTPDYEKVQQIWYQDAAFMAEVEDAAGEGAMLFTLPYMKNFENGSLNNMWDYTLLRGPLHSRTLKFTYGAGYGTQNDLWYKETSALEPEAMIAELRAQGMTGIYLDLDGYAVEDQQATLAGLTAAAGCAPGDVITSESGMLCYIPLGQE